MPPEHGREGFAFSISVGPAGLGGTGGESSLAGIGGSLALAIKTEAGPSFLWVIKIDGASYLFRDVVDRLKINQQTILAAGAQIYLREVLWIEGGAGIGVVRSRDRKTGLDDLSRTGVGAIFSVGYDVYRHGSFVVALAACSGAGVYRDAVAAHGGIRLNASWY